MATGRIACRSGHVGGPAVSDPANVGGHHTRRPGALSRFGDGPPGRVEAARGAIAQHGREAADGCRGGIRAVEEEGQATAVKAEVA
jgi:hypothetical protein